jgi:hypothetical protein
MLLMQPLPLVPKAYSMLRQEKKQSDTLKQPGNTPIALNSFRNTSYTPPHRNNTPNNPVPNTSSDRRSSFRKGIFCAYCKKEGHSKEECYKLLGYPPGHPLHNKYQPPSQRTTSQPNRGGRSVNMVTGETLPPIDITKPMSPLYQCSTSESHNVAELQMNARMDQLKNQLNQVLLMMQNAQGESSGMATHMAGILSFSNNIKIPLKIAGIHSFSSIAKMHSFIASNITNISHHHRGQHLNQTGEVDQ